MKKPNTIGRAAVYGVAGLVTAAVGVSAASSLLDEQPATADAKATTQTVPSPAPSQPVPVAVPAPAPRVVAEPASANRVAVPVVRRTPVSRPHTARKAPARQALPGHAKPIALVAAVSPPPIAHPVALQSTLDSSIKAVDTAGRAVDQADKALGKARDELKQAKADLEKLRKELAEPKTAAHEVHSHPRHEKGQLVSSLIPLVRTPVGHPGEPVVAHAQSAHSSSTAVGSPGSVVSASANG